VLHLDENAGPTAVVDFEEDVRRVWSCHPYLSREVKVDMIWMNIGPVPRDEIRCHPAADQTDPESVFKILHHVFGDHRKMGDLFLVLFNMHQKINESLIHYSHRLMSTQRAYNHACLRADCLILPNCDLLALFVKGIRDSDNRRQLNYELCRNQRLSFIELRDLALIWEVVPTPAPITAPLRPDSPPETACSLTVTVDAPTDPLLSVPLPGVSPVRRRRRRRRRSPRHSEKCNPRDPEMCNPRDPEISNPRDTEVTLYCTRVPVCQVRRHSRCPRDPYLKLKCVPALMSINCADFVTELKTAETEIGIETVNMDLQTVDKTTYRPEFMCLLIFCWTCVQLLF